MPRALEPGVTFDVELAGQDHLAVEARAVIVLRSLSCREWAAVARIHTEIIGTSTLAADEQMRRTLDGIRKGLVGWRHLVHPETGAPLPYDPADLDLAIDHREALELLFELLRGNRTCREEKKTSDSQP